MPCMKGLNVDCQQIVLRNLDINTLKKKNIPLVLTLYTLKSKWMQMLIWTRNVEMLEGGIGKTLQDTGIDKSILKRTPSGSSTNAGKDMKTQQTSHTVSGNVKQCSCYRRKVRSKDKYHVSVI